MGWLQSLRIKFAARVHATWIFTATCTGFIAGVAMSRSCAYFTIFYLLCSIVFIALSVIRRSNAMLVFALAGGICLGLLRGQILIAEYAAYEHYTESKYVVTGVVKESPTQSRPGLTTVRMTNIMINGAKLPGIITADIANDGTPLGIVAGDSVSVEGKIQNGYGAIAARIADPKLQSIERSPNVSLLSDIKNKAMNAIDHSIGEPESSLGIGFLLGEKRSLPPDLIAALQVAGLTHIVVASGYNVSILVRITRRTFMNLSKFLAAYSGALLAGGFVLLTGFSPSMTRAALVAGLSLIAWYDGRAFHPVTLLSFVASLTLLIQPEFAWGDVGWQLSFAAFAGVMIVAPILQAYFFGDDKPSLLGQVLIETLAAQLLTAPIIAVVFGQFSVIALFANIVIVPFVPIAMLLVLLSAFFQLFMPLITPIFSFPAELLLRAMVAFITWISQIEWAQITIVITEQIEMVMYIAIGLAAMWMYRRTHLRLRTSNLVK
jgi:competence protein ComEC